MRALAKVCGLTSGADAVQAAGLGADLLGFVQHPPSPRHCPDPALARPFLDRAVLVMVATEAGEILDRARQFGFRWVQPHLPAAERAPGAALLKEAGCALLLPWPDEPGLEPAAADLYLWEPSPAVTGLAGGSGRTHGMAFPPPGPFLLAGGLDGINLAARVEALPPAARCHLQGFDAASRLEAAPGRKDPARVAAFLAAAHSLEMP